VIVGQRIHEQDVPGYVLRERPDWEHLNLPAFFEPSHRCTTAIGWTDPRQQEGDLLWPERFSRATLEGLKRDLGTSGFAAQYQQTPVPSGGGQFKEEWLRYSKQQGDYYLLQTPAGDKPIAIKDCWRFIVVDLAISSKQEADYTVIQTWAVSPEKDMLLIEQLRGRYDNPEQQKILQLAYQRHAPDFLCIESVSYQLALIQQLLLQGIPCCEYKPIKDKVSRASTAAIYMEAGKIYFDMTLPELAEIKMELLHFPKYRHDDIVDSCSMAADIVSMPRPTPGMLLLTPKQDPLRDTLPFPVPFDDDAGDGWL
jgi:predicted phage terminase large subunit-like protein